MKFSLANTAKVLFLRYFNDALIRDLHRYCRTLFPDCQRYDGWRCMCLILLSFVIAYIIISLMVDVTNYYFEIPDFFWE